MFVDHYILSFTETCALLYIVSYLKVYQVKDSQFGFQTDECIVLNEFDGSPLDLSFVNFSFKVSLSIL